MWRKMKQKNEEKGRNKAKKGQRGSREKKMRAHNAEKKKAAERNLDFFFFLFLYVWCKLTAGIDSTPSVPLGWQSVYVRVHEQGRIIRRQAGTR